MNALARLVLPAVLAATGCAAGADEPPAAAPSTATGSTSTSPTTTPSPSPPPPPSAAVLQGLRLALQPVTSVERPTSVVEHEGALVISEIAGRVRVVRDGALQPEPLLDISDDVGTRGEGGLLDLAFDPGGEHLYVSYTNTEQDTRVVEYTYRDGTVDPASRREVLAVDQPDVRHNGGHIAFGPDGMLWIGLGDGGHTKTAPRNAQDEAALLGSILRIDPEPSGGLPYTVPPDNPFVGRGDARPEVWAKGVRNPWRWSFDDQGRLWVGDVGGHHREEVSVLDPDEGGANLGWPALEGTRPYGDGVPVPPDAEAPVIEYAHDDDLCSVVGGHVYEGSLVPALRGAYVYADTCQARLRAASVVDERVVAEHVFDDAAVAPRTLVSLGEDSDGELYVVSIDGPVYRVVPA